MNNLKCSKSILLLRKSQYYFHYALSYRHLVTQTKEIMKLKPVNTIIHKRFHHHVTFYVNQSLVSQNVTGNSLLYPNTRITQPHSIVQKRYLIQKELKPAIDEYLSEKIEEDRRYYQYHPSEAKRLAVSYLQEKTVRQALEHLIPKRRPLVLLHHANILQQELAYIVQPAIKRQEIALNYAFHNTSQQPPSQQPLPHKEQITKKEVIVEKVEIEHLIKTVYREIEKRMQQKQQRKGR